MSRLHELAQRLGVRVDTGEFIASHDILLFRPDKDIAHDMLAKLPDSYELHWLEFDQWYWRDIGRACPACGKEHNEHEQGTFEEAVCALAERHLEQKP